MNSTIHPLRLVLDRVASARIEAARRRREPWAWPAAEVPHALLQYKPHLRMRCRQPAHPELRGLRTFKIEYVFWHPERNKPPIVATVTYERWQNILPEDWERLRRRFDKNVTRVAD